jgi:hypothetical protein
VPQCSRTELASDEAYVSLHDVASEPWLPTTVTLMALVVRGEALTRSGQSNLCSESRSSSRYEQC